MKASPIRRRKAHPWMYNNPMALQAKQEIQARRNKNRNPWNYTKEELHEIRAAPYVKLPIEEREYSNKSTMLTLRMEEMKKIRNNWPRNVDRFKAGDRIKITKYITLGRDNKVEVVKGMCIGRTFRNLESYFRIINWKIDVMYEMNIPLWSPFIKSIEVLQAGKISKAKCYWMKERPFKEYITK